MPIYLCMYMDYFIYFATEEEREKKIKKQINIYPRYRIDRDITIF